METELVNKFEQIHSAFEKHAYDDLTHFAELAETLKRIEQKTDAQSTILQPMAETYATATTLGKWLMPILLAISLIVGIVWGVIQITLHK